MSNVCLNEFVKDLKNKSHCDFNSLDWFNILVRELEIFSIANDLDIHIIITDTTNNNTRLVMEIKN